MYSLVLAYSSSLDPLLRWNLGMHSTVQNFNRIMFYGIIRQGVSFKCKHFSRCISRRDTCLDISPTVSILRKSHLIEAPQDRTETLHGKLGCNDIR